MSKYACLFAVGILAACATGNTENDFLCGAEEGQPCASMSEVDGVTSGATRSVPERTADSQNKSLTQARVAGAKGSASDVFSGGAAYTTSQYRVPEVTGRLWMAPHVDDSGLLHEGTYVHFVVRDASWGNR